jgi:hypothetical protein
MSRVRRSAKAWLVLWLGRIVSTLLQIRIVKPTFGRPRYRYDLGETWTIGAEQGVRPNLDEVPLSGDDPCLLADSLHLSDEMTQLGDE